MRGIWLIKLMECQAILLFLLLFIFNFYQQNAPKYRIYYIIMCLECMIFIVKIIIMVHFNIIIVLLFYYYTITI